MAPARDQNHRRVRSGDRRPDHAATPADETTGSHEHVRRGSPFYSATEEAFKNKRTMRFLSAGAIALLVLIVVALFGPSREEVKRRFEIYGAEGPLEIMPDISIDDGSDAISQLPAAFRQPPPPVVDVEPIDPTANPVEFVPPQREQPSESTPVETTDIETADTGVAQAELILPQQSNPDFIILNMPRPLYPLTASTREQRLPIVRVDVAIFVDANGQVTASMITASEGGPPFTEAVLAAMVQWEFEWSRNAVPAVGRWMEMSWRFKSPYAATRPAVTTRPADDR